jgi:3-dehydroquinate synthase
MKTLTISFHEKQKHYPILIGSNILSEIENHINLEIYSQIVIITDQQVAKYHLKSIKDALPHATTDIVLPPGEGHKTIKTAQTIWDQLLEKGFDRKSLVLNLGGGVVGDMGGFAAATFMRGIDFIQIPTTLLAQVDASVGGKLGINFGEVKNIIGSFQQPKAVVIDTSFLSTLPDRERSAGFAEIIKHGLIHDARYFERVTKKQPEDFSADELTEIISQSCEIKADLVQTDETEFGSRKLLNFGHTIGHAIESLSHETEEPLLHGEAIAIGMVGEAKLSEEMGYIETDDMKQIEDALKKAGLPVRTDGFDIKKMKEKMKSDKKNAYGQVKWTLLKRIGEADYNIHCGEGLVERALEYINTTT